MARITEKDIYCRKCKRFLFTTVITKGEAWCSTCKTVTAIQQAREKVAKPLVK